MLRQFLYKCVNKKGLSFFQHKCWCCNRFPDTILYNAIKLSRPICYALTTTNQTGNNRYYSSSNINTKAVAATEAEYLVKMKDNPDVFGDSDNTDIVDENDMQDELLSQEKPVASQKLSTKQYADVIKSFLRKRKIKEAIDYVEIHMVKEDRVQPENYIYNLLIGACGRVGYTKKAFSLYNDMKRRALKITPGTYTALFNACSNSPWPTTDGLSRAQHLRNIMIEKMYEPNDTNYHSMIKAFGRGGDLITAFALVDEMAAKGYVIKSDTLNFLLQACITDKEAGFRHALLVWRKFIQKNVTPSLFSYNLMLRCIRDCGLGDIETTKDVINHLLPSSEKALMLEDMKTQKKLMSGETAADIALVVNTPNLMAKVPHLGNILSLEEVTKPEDRLVLVGGCKQFLKNMSDNNCQPDIKTFTQLLDNIPSTMAAEKELILDLKRNNISADIDFYNMLIKKRSMRFDYESAQDVLGMIGSSRLMPNLITYGVLAIGCKSKEEAELLLEEMLKCNYRLNVEILGAMLQQASYHLNFPYVIYILELCIKEEIRPGQKFLDKLANFKKRCNAISNDQNNELSSSVKFQKEYRLFKMRYKSWLKEIQIDDSENVHPWQQYREKSDVNTKYYKDKEEKSRFKPVHKSLFRRKTTTQNSKK